MSQASEYFARVDTDLATEPMANSPFGFPLREELYLLYLSRVFSPSINPAQSNAANLRSNRSPSSAALYLLELLLLNNQAHHDISDLLDLARYCVNVILQSAHFRHSQLSILRDLAQLFLYREPAFQLRPRLVLWRVIAEYASEALSLASPSASHGGRLQSLGHEYKDAVKLLELGVQQHSTDILPTWRRLYNGVLQMIDLEVGSAGTTIMVGQPLAAAVRKEIQSQCNEASITVAVSVLQKVYWPQSRQLVDRAQHQLWGTTQQGYSSITFDLVEDIYLLVNAVLIESYEAIDTLPTDTQTSAIRAVTSFMHSCPPVSRARLLGSVQSGLAIWIEDSRGAMDRRKPDVYPSVRSRSTQTGFLTDHSADQENVGLGSKYNRDRS